MSYVLNAGVAPFCHSQNYSGGVPVSTVGVSAVSAREDAYGQFESLRGSCKATRTGHGRVRGLDDHHLPPSPCGTLEEFAFSCSDGRIGGFSGHCAAAKKFRLKVFDCNEIVLVDDFLCPDTCVVLGLPCGFFVQFRRFASGLFVSLRLRPMFAAAGHLPLGFREFGGATLAMSEVVQIMLGGGGCGGDGDSPVDSDPSSRRGSSFGFAAHHERCIPVAEAVLGDTNGTRRTGKFARPYDRDGNSLWECESPVLDGESPRCVLEGRQCSFPGLVHRPVTTLDGEGVVQGSAVGAEHLLLRNLRAVAQPLICRASHGQKFGQLGECRLPTRLPLVHCLIPQEPAAMPFIDQCAFRLRAGAQAVVVAHYLFHEEEYYGTVLWFIRC